MCTVHIVCTSTRTCALLLMLHADDERGKWFEMIKIIERTIYTTHIMRWHHAIFMKYVTSGERCTSNYYESYAIHSTFHFATNANISVNIQCIANSEARLSINRAKCVIAVCSGNQRNAQQKWKHSIATNLNKTNTNNVHCANKMFLWNIIIFWMNKFHRVIAAVQTMRSLCVCMCSSMMFRIIRNIIIFSEHGNSVPSKCWI